MAEYTRNAYGLVESDAFYLISPAGKDHLSRQWPYLAAAIKSVRPFFEGRHVDGKDWDAKLQGLSFGDLRKRHRWRVASHYETDDGKETFYLQINRGTDNQQDWETRFSVPGTGSPHIVTTFEPSHFYTDTQADGSDVVYLKRPAPSLDFSESSAPTVILPGSELVVNSDHFYLETTRDNRTFPLNRTPQKVKLNLANNYALASDVGANYIHAQTVAAVEWTVVHNFNKSDMLWAIQDDQGRTIEADEIDFSNPNQAYFYFNQAIRGRIIVSTGNVGETFTGVDNVGVDISDGTNTFLAAQEVNVNPNYFYLSVNNQGEPVLNFIPSSAAVTFPVECGTDKYLTADGVDFSNTYFYLSPSTPATRPVVNIKTDAMPFGRTKRSGNLSITIGGKVTWAHGLGSEPDLVVLKLVCVTNDSTYTAGDVVYIGGSYGNNGSFTSERTMDIQVDSTNVYVTNAGTAILINAKNGGAYQQITASSWRYSLLAALL